MLTYTTDDGGLALSIAFDRLDSLQHNRHCWRFTITDCGTGRVLAEGDDLTTVEPTSEADALASLATFLGAWAEAVDGAVHWDRPPENADLFPAAMLGALDASAWAEIAWDLEEAITGHDRERA